MSDSDSSIEVTEVEVPKLSSKTLSFYAQQTENKSRILYNSGNEFIISSKFEKYISKYIFHVCFQLSSIVDYVSKFNLKTNYYLYIAIKFIRN